jgi:serine/threonine protein kinase
VLTWFTQICLGLENLRKKHLHHGDLKPSHIYIVEVGSERVAKVGSLFKDFIRPKNTIIGSACYLPPEVFKGTSRGLDD